MAKVYDKNGKAYNVTYAVDVKEWLDSGYTLDEPKGAKGKVKPVPAPNLLDDKD